MELFNSKILLFGEYGLLKGSMGLAIPFSEYSGELIIPDVDSILSRKQLDSNSDIKKLAIYISHQESFKNNNNVLQLLEDTLLGLYFESNIPKSYGVGSSGALVAAIYNKYFYFVKNTQIQDKKRLKLIKNDLSVIESFFHGKSSGIDPIVSYLNIPVLINAPINHFNSITSDNIKIFLIDTRKPSSTKNFVKLFNAKCNNEKDLLNNYIKKTNEVIISFLENDKNLFIKIQEFCNIEKHFLSEMFYYSKEIENILKTHNSNLCVKLCGSGGGGFLLGITTNKYYTEILNNFSIQNVVTIPISLNYDTLINI